MKKLFLVFFLFLLFLAPVLAKADGPLVPCGNGTPVYDNTGKCTSNCPCTICDFFTLLANIYTFIVFNIAAPLAIISLIAGGVLILVSAGNPNLMSLGKKIVFSAIIGLALVFGSYLIIDTVLSILGYNMGTWWNPSFNCT